MSRPATPLPPLTSCTCSVHNLRESTKLTRRFVPAVVTYADPVVFRRDQRLTALDDRTLGASGGVRGWSNSWVAVLPWEGDGHDIPIAVNHPRHRLLAQVPAQLEPPVGQHRRVDHRNL